MAVRGYKLLHEGKDIPIAVTAKKKTGLPNLRHYAGNYRQFYCIAGSPAFTDTKIFGKIVKLPAKKKSNAQIVCPILTEPLLIIGLL
ncbi:MAG: hypothetical protein KZQ70_13395 [gamma proteobacterium symbiont of Lucinoma myriamae]|nr:hypothetical protein [gamma proteobacterium symbiont of Lucinoma myriamae]